MKRISRHERFVSDAFQQYERLLYLPEEIEGGVGIASLSETDQQALKQVVYWLRHFIMAPNPALGRSGPVCPFVKPAMDEQLIYLTVTHLEDPFSIEAINEEIWHYQKIFSIMEPLSGPNKTLRVIMALFPDTPEHIFDDPRYLKILKTEMMKQDVTIGHFFPSGKIQQVLKSKFFPVQPPVPFMVMRTMIESDWVFISEEREWREVYKGKFPMSEYMNPPAKAKLLGGKV